MGKIITHFDPVTNRTFEEAEGHYLEVHTEFARQMFREHSPGVLTYLLNRAMREYSVAGKFNQKPLAWRWVVMDTTEDVFLPARFEPNIWRDHRNVLKSCRCTPVEPTLVHDRLNGQTAIAKVLIQHNRASGQSQDEGLALYRSRHLETLSRLLPDAFGFRRYISNDVLMEMATEPNEEEGQVILPEPRPETEILAYDEIWFDNETWIAEFFAQRALYDLLHFGGLDTRAYLIWEVAALDRR